MHRGCRNTETKAVNNAPLAGALTAVGEGAEPPGPAKATRAIRMTMQSARNVCQCFITPPIDESASVEFVSLSRRRPHSRLRAQRRGRPARQFLPTSRYSPQYAFQSQGIRSCEASERNENSSAAAGHCRM